MVILALDSTSEAGGVGIFRDHACLSLELNAGPANRYSVTLFEMAERACARARLTLADIELFAAANGPGSFTGIRVGLAAARGWGKALGRRVRGVSVLAALVHKHVAGMREPPPGCLFPILDARRGEFFTSCFRQAGLESAAGNPAGAPPGALPVYLPADSGRVLKPAALRDFLVKQAEGYGNPWCLVRAQDAAASSLRPGLPLSFGWGQVAGPLMDSIAAIARAEEEAGGAPASSSLEACYIRRPDAEIGSGAV